MKYILFSIAALACIACAKVDSQDVTSQGIYATFSVVGDSVGSATATAILQVGGPTGTYLDLDDGDSVTCEGLDLQREDDLIGEVSYVANVPYQVGRTYHFVFQHGGQVYEADAVLPEPVQVTSPANLSFVPASASLDLTWAFGASRSYDMAVSVDGPDSSSFFNTGFPDPGSQFLPAGTFALSSGSISGNFTITVQRSLAGTFPSGLDGGQTYGEQDGEVSVTATH